MSEIQKCPWCGAAGQPTGIGRYDWLCGSFRQGDKLYQSADCRNKVLETEVARLRAVVRQLRRTLYLVQTFTAKPDRETWRAETHRLCGEE